MQGWGVLCACVLAEGWMGEVRRERMGVGGKGQHSTSSRLAVAPRGGVRRLELFIAAACGVVLLLKPLDLILALLHVQPSAHMRGKNDTKNGSCWEGVYCHASGITGTDSTNRMAPHCAVCVQGGATHEHGSLQVGLHLHVGDERNTRRELRTAPL